MKKVIFVLLAMVSTAVYADSYHVVFGWTDPTTYIASDAPTYTAKYRVNGGTETVLAATAMPSGSVTVTAAPGQPIDVAGQACNKGLCSAWTGWVTATAPYPATQPETQTGMTITVTRTGP